MFRAELKATPRFASLGRYLKSLPKRGTVALRWLTYQAATQLQQEVEARIPNKEEYGVYRKSLEVVVGPSRRGESIAGVRAGVRKRKVRKLKPEATVLYVKGRRGARRKDDAVSVLEKHSPWTLDTLPFYPSRKVAIVVSRNVTEKEVRDVARARTKSRVRWERELSRAGIRHVKRTKVKPPRGARALTDVAFEGARLEFGIGGTKAAPHWAPGVREVRKYVSWLLRKSKFLRDLLLRDKPLSALRWRPLGRARIKGPDLVAILPFAKRVR